MDDLSGFTHVICQERPDSGSTQGDDSFRLTRDEAKCLRSRRAFPMIEGLEQHESASQSRRASCARTTHEFNMAFDEALERMYAPLLDDVGRWAIQNGPEHQLWLPSFSSGAEMRSAALLGPSLHASLAHRLRAKLSNATTACVTLGHEDFDGLAKAFKAIIRKVRGVALYGQGADENETTGPSIRNDEGLEALYDIQGKAGAKIEHIILSVASLPSHPLGVLQDLIHALHAFSATLRAPRISLLLWLPTADSSSASHDGASVILDDALPLPTSVRRLLDVKTFPLPGVDQAWDALTEALWLRYDSQPSLWLGPRAWTDIEQRFRENDFSLEQVLRSLQLAVFHHFSTSVRSALAYADLIPPPGDFTAAFITRARFSATEYSERKWGASFEDTDLKTLLAQFVQLDDELLLRSIASLRVNYQSRGRGRLLALRALRTIDKLLDRRGDTTMAAMWSATLGEEGGPSEVNKRLTLLRGETVSSICKILAAIQELVVDHASLQLHDAALELFQDELTDWLVDLAGDEDDESGSDLDQEELDPAEQEERRLDRLSRQLRKDEHLTTEKRAVIQRLGTSLRHMLRPLHDLPFAEIYVYDHTEELADLLDAAPRAVLLGALSEPSRAFRKIPTNHTPDSTLKELQKEREAALARGVVPDTSRAYSLFSDAGKSLNLANWHDAFAQGLESTLPAQARRPKQAFEHEVQVRFAKSVNEMAALGMIKRTGRKPEHVAKTIFDLPP